MSHRSMIPAPAGHVYSRIEKSSSTLPSPLVSSGTGQMMTPGGPGPSNSTDFSDQSLRSSTYTSPYLRGPFPTTPGGNITTGIGSLGIGGFQVPGTPRSRLTTNAGTVGHGASGQPPVSVGTFGQGSSAQSSPTAGTFGPALAQPATPQYIFLVSGDLATGPCFNSRSFNHSKDERLEPPMEGHVTRVLGRFFSYQSQEMFRD